MPYDSRMHGFCSRCTDPGRDVCTELCSIAAEYVSKGYVGQQEYLPGVPIGHWESLLNPMPYRDMSRLSAETRKTLILLLHKDGKAKNDIAIHVECNRKYVQKVIANWELRKGGATKSRTNYLKLCRK